MSKQIVFLDISQMLIKDSELAQTQLIFTDALRKVFETFANTDIEITLERPSGDHSTLYITSIYDNSNGIIGIAQQDYTGDPNDIGMINYNEITNVVNQYGLDPQQHSNLLANSISHEIGHLMGLEHSNDPNDIMHDGVNPNMWNETLEFSDDQINMINEMVSLSSNDITFEDTYYSSDDLDQDYYGFMDDDNPDQTDYDSNLDDDYNSLI